MKKKHLVLGATGSIGYAYTRELLDSGIETTILTRNQKKASSLFRNHPLLDVIEGDPADTDTLHNLAGTYEFIFFGINFPYQQWSEKMKPLTSNDIYHTFK